MLQQTSDSIKLSLKRTAYSLDTQFREDIPSSLASWVETVMDQQIFVMPQQKTLNLGHKSCTGVPLCTAPPPLTARLWWALILVVLPEAPSWGLNTEPEPGRILRPRSVRRSLMNDGEFLPVGRGWMLSCESTLYKVNGVWLLPLAAGWAGQMKCDTWYWWMLSWGALCVCLRANNKQGDK